MQCLVFFLTLKMFQFFTSTSFRKMNLVGTFFVELGTKVKNSQLFSKMYKNKKINDEKMRNQFSTKLILFVWCNRVTQKY